MGYGFRSGFFTANLNAYYTRWMDKAMYDSGDMRDSDRYTLNMTGANADHWGLN